MRILRNINLLHRLRIRTLQRPRIHAGIVHDRRQGRRRRIEILHLLRLMVNVPQVLCQLNRILHGAARMRADQIRHQILIHTAGLIHLIITPCKCGVNAVRRFSERPEHRVGYMFRRHLQLPGDMPADEFFEKRIIMIQHDIIKPHPGTDKHLLDAVQIPQLLQKRGIGGMIHFQIRAGLREEALSVLACSYLQLLVAGRLMKVRRRSAHIMDVTFEIRIPDQPFCLFQNRLIASCLDNPSLVKIQRAEIACTKAPSVRGNRKLHFGKSRDPACGVIIRVPGSCIGKRVDIVHFLLRERLRRGILHNIHRTVRLHQRLCIEGIRIAVLLIKTHRIIQTVLSERIPVRQHDRICQRRRILRLIAGPCNECKIFDIQSGIKRLRDLHDRMLTHPIGNQVRAAVHEKGPAQAVTPVIIVRHAPQRCLDASGDNRCMPEDGANQVAVHHAGPVRPSSHHAARTVGVRLPVLF